MSECTDEAPIQSGTRRAFLKGGLGAMVTASALEATLDKPFAQNAPAIGSAAPDIAVIGAGAFGAWTALTLRERGIKVTMVDAYGPGNPRATSAGETRQIRYGYGDREIYTRSAVKAMRIWKAREKEWGVQLLYPGTRLSVEKQWSPRLEAEKRIFDNLHLSYEVVNADELGHRYPQVSFEGLVGAFVEPDVAMIKARDAILKIADEFRKQGGITQIGKAVPGPATGRRLEAVALGGDQTLRAGIFVFACGPWLQKIFPNVLSKKLMTTRCDVVFFGPPAGDVRFSWPNFPQLNGEFSTYPAFEGGGGVKVIPVGGGILDPDEAERVVAPEQIWRAREYIARRVPALKDLPITRDEVCQFEMAADEDFLIDKHPDYDNVWIAGGGSSHGFKHGPVLGEYIASRVLGDPSDPELQKLFSLAGHKDVGAATGMGG